MRPVQVVAILSRACQAWFAFTVLLLSFILGATRSASAQAPTPSPAPSWTENNAYQAWIAFHDYFYTPGKSGGDIIADERIGDKQGDRWSVFWQEVEDIEVAEDAYYWAAKHGGDKSKYVTYVDELCSGFIKNMYPKLNFGPPHCSVDSDRPVRCDKLDWSGNIFNDDLMWSSIAFARAYQITGNREWLKASEKQFNTVWERAQTGNGGLIQSQPHELKSRKPWGPNLDAPVNFPFVIAGYLIYNNTHEATYKDRADKVYAWAKANLLSTTRANGGPCTGHPELMCTKVYDANNTGSFANYHEFKGTGISAFDFAYNYGTAIQAAIRVGGPENEKLAESLANYLMYNMDNPNSKYAGVYNGYNILPKYAQPEKDAKGPEDAGNGTNDAGYNGIALRAIGLGLDRKGSNGQPILDEKTLDWAQANLQAAWDIRNKDNVMWNDWVHKVEKGYTYHAWDCSNAVAGMLDIPAPK